MDSSTSISSPDPQELLSSSLAKLDQIISQTCQGRAPPLSGSNVVPAATKTDVNASLYMPPALSQTSTIPNFAPTKPMPLMSTNVQIPPAPLGTQWHKQFNFSDGTVIFTVGNTSFRVYRHFFERDSALFASALTLGLSSFIPGGVIPAPKTTFIQTKLSGSSLPISMPVPTFSLSNVRVDQMEAFLSVLFPLDFDHGDLNTEIEWSSVLKLADMWRFKTVRGRAVRQLDTLVSPFRRLMLAYAYNIEEWVTRALVELCARDGALALEEIQEMRHEDIALVINIREKVLGLSSSLYPSPHLRPSRESLFAQVNEWRAQARLPQSVLDTAKPLSEPPKFVEGPKTSPGKASIEPQVQRMLGRQLSNDNTQRTPLSPPSFALNHQVPRAIVAMQPSGNHPSPAHFLSTHYSALNSSTTSKAAATSGKYPSYCPMPSHYDNISRGTFNPTSYVASLTAKSSNSATMPMNMKQQYPELLNLDSMQRTFRDYVSLLNGHSATEATPSTPTVPEIFPISVSPAQAADPSKLSPTPPPSLAPSATTSTSTTEARAPSNGSPEPTAQSSEENAVKGSNAKEDSDAEVVDGGDFSDYSSMSSDI
ncbi:hypothetical protein OF83DRAFT_1285013 [Amylostereum chailletii]|nr:hypothetical protein OF83DRAFT_1285013 [Amylostereum chailletii]